MAFKVDLSSWVFGLGVWRTEVLVGDDEHSNVLHLTDVLVFSVLCFQLMIVMEG